LECRGALLSCCNLRRRGVGLLGFGVVRALLADGESGEPLAHVDGALKSLTLGDTGEEASGEGVTGTGGVGNVGLVDLVDGESLDVVLALDGDDGRLGALSDDGKTLALLVLLGKVGEVLSDGGDVGGLEVVGLGVGGGLGLAADNVVPVRGGRSSWSLKNWQMKGAFRERPKGLFFAAASSARAMMAGTQTVRW